MLLEIKSMRTRQPLIALFILAFTVYGQGWLAACEEIAAKDLKFEARLVWGTDGAKPKESKLHDLPPYLDKKLKKIFRWKHYYGVSQQTSFIPLGKTEKIKMSQKCLVKIRNSGERHVEVSVFGEGKHILTKKQEVVPGELVIVAGDCEKDDTAWFVVLKPMAVK